VHAVIICSPVILKHCIVGIICVHMCSQNNGECVFIDRNCISNCYIISENAATKSSELRHCVQQYCLSQNHADISW